MRVKIIVPLLPLFCSSMFRVDRAITKGHKHTNHSGCGLDHEPKNSPKFYLTNLKIDFKCLWMLSVF
uniref:Uncharacterized protein n=1 Tax=Solanum tuberosum TaxID=4113 RepID=M1BZV1_SOLTU